MSLPESTIRVIEALATPALLVSRAGLIVLANRPARDAFAVGDARPDRSLLELVAEPGDTIADYLRMCARSPEPLLGTLTLRDSSQRWVAYVCSGALVSPKSETLPTLLLLRLDPRERSNPFILLSQTVEELTNEVKRRRDAEAALRESETKLRTRILEVERAGRLKDEFLAAVSHELRTPLNAILGWSDLLRSGNLDDERRARGLEVIARNARAQVQLIDELLDVSRIVSGKMRINVQQIDPLLAIEAAIETIRPALDIKDIRLNAVLDPLAGPISGDPDRLQQIVWNLLSNAMKFTPKGGRVQVVLERIQSSIELTVSDTGQGITSEFLPHVFDRFRQEESSTTRKHGGLGLGLSIVKSLVELHGGAVRAESAGPGQGCTFVVQLPRALVKPGDTPRPFASVVTVSGSSAMPRSYLMDLKILVVDDEADAVDLLAELLGEFGAIVVKCGSADDAYRLVQSTLPDVVISDIGMPEEDGYSLIQRIRSLPRDAGGATVAVALTAFARTEDRTRVLTSGFQAHIPKPVELAELLAVIGSVTGRFVRHAT